MEQGPRQKDLRLKKTRRRRKKIDTKNRSAIKTKTRGITYRRSYFRNFGDKTPPRPQNQEQMDSNEANRDAESTVSANLDGAVTTHEPRVYPAIPVQNYRDGPIEDIAVHYVRINRKVDQKATRNKQQDFSVRAAELDFMLDLETLFKETAADPDLK